MSSLLKDWPFKCVDTKPWSEFQNGDRVKHYLGAIGTVQGYDHHNPCYYYVLWDGFKIPSRILSSSLEKCDD